MTNFVEDCKFIDLKTFPDPRGKLFFIQNDEVEVPFSFQRMYCLFDIPYGAERAAHAHRQLHQLFFSLSGSYLLTLDDGKCSKNFIMDKPDRPLYVPPGLWRVVSNFTSGAVCLVLASHLYSPSDYINDYQEFLAYRRGL